MFLTSSFVVQPPGGRPAPVRVRRRTYLALLVLTLLTALVSPLIGPARTSSAATTAASTSNAASTASLKLAAAAAAGGGAAPSAVTKNTGDFTTSINFQVPAYHGLQPQLGLAYDSLAGNGLVGQGWQLIGFPEVDRTSFERGAPRFDGSDIFQLNGEDLVPNTGLGGQYVTKRQNFERISYNAATNSWLLVDKKGILYTLGPVVQVGPATNRWLITQATDRHGNIVHYTYWCDPGQQCYPSTVIYNGNSITFYLEARSDVISQAIGGLTTTNYRVKTVEVQVGTAIARVYALSYTTSAATGRSLLTTVTQYGSDATLDASGTVTGGTALPPIKANYQVDGTKAFTGDALVLGGFCGREIHGEALFTADVNGDGKTDLICADPSPSYPYTAYSYSVALSTGGGFSNPTVWLSNWCSIGNVHTVDVTGNGKTDLVCTSEPGVYGPYTISVALSNGSNAFVPGPNNGLWLGGWCSGYAPSIQFADVNGDGRVDAVCVIPNGSGLYDTTNVYVAVSNGSSAFVIAGASNGLWLSNCAGRPILADVSGDGKADALCHSFDYYGATPYYVALSTGSSFASPTLWLNSWCGGQYGGTYTADVNGDGKTDLVCEVGTPDYWGNTIDNFFVALSNGSNAFTLGSGNGLWLSSWCDSYATYYPVFSHPLLADVNGDGKTDLLCVSSTQNNLGTVIGTNYSVALSNGSSAFVGAGQWLSDGGTCDAANLPHLVDTNGDGKIDLLCKTRNYGYIYRATAGSQTAQNDLLTSLTNQNGGTTSITYIPGAVPGNPTKPFPALFGSVTGSLGTPLPLVTSIAQNAGVSWDAPPIVTNYTSSDPIWDAVERRFLGYGTIVASNSSGATATTIFRQVANYAVNRPARVSITDANGTLLSYTTYTYQESAAGGVYTALLSKISRANCAGASLCQASSTTYQYDGYGNTTQQLENGGDATPNGGDATPGHERLTVTGYHPNTGAYLVSYPAEQTVYAGTSTTAPKVSDVFTSYDGQANSAPPVKGDVTAVSNWLNTTGGLLTTTSSYDGYGNALSATDALGHTRTTSYDSTYHLYATQVCNALKQCMTQGWNTVLGMQTSQVDQANTGTPTTTMAYDVFGRVVKKTLPDGSFTTTGYVNLGNPTTQYTQTALSDGSADGLWTRTYLDGSGRTYQTLQKSTTTITTMYNAQGQMAAVSAPYFTGATPQYTTYQYDALGRQTVLTYPDGATQTTSYTVGINTADADFKTARLLVTNCDELKYCIRQAMDGYGQTVIVDELVSGTTYDARTHVSYDLLGNLIGYTNALGSVASMTYDSLGRKVVMTDPDLGHWTYAYDAAGNLLSQTDARGITVSYTYDALNRLLTEKSGAIMLVNNTYDQVSQPQGVGRLTSMSDPSGSTTFGYDVNGRLVVSTKVITGQSFRMGESYDQAGRVASLTYPDGEVVAYGYDASGCLKSVGKYVTSASCTANGSLAGQTLGNGLHETMNYSPTRQWLTGLTIAQGSTTLLSYNTSNRDARGQLLAQTSSNPSLNWNYQYDALGRLTQATNTTNASWSQLFTYDVLGRVFPGTGGQKLTYPAAGHIDAPATHNGTAYTYDADGNRTGGDGHTYTYDALDRLVNVSGTAYLYDGMGNRVQAGSTRYLSFDNRLLSQQIGASKLQFYYYGNTRIARKDQAGTVTYYLNDQLGTANSLNSSSGTGTGQAVYGPYGKPLQQSGTSDPFGLAGQQLDASGLYHMGARYMDPTSASFTSPDSSGHAVNPLKPQTLNRYAYANNDPVDVTDPSGYGSGDTPPTVYDFQTGTVTALTKDYLGFRGYAVTVNPATGETSVTNLLLKGYSVIPGTGGLAEINTWAGTTALKNGSSWGLFAFADIRPTVESPYLSLRFRYDMLFGADILKFDGSETNPSQYYVDHEFTIRLQAGPYADTLLDINLNNQGQGFTASGVLKDIWDYVTGPEDVAQPNPNPSIIGPFDSETSSADLLDQLNTIDGMNTTSNGSITLPPIDVESASSPAWPAGWSEAASSSDSWFNGSWSSVSSATGDSQGTQTPDIQWGGFSVGD